MFCLKKQFYFEFTKSSGFGSDHPTSEAVNASMTLGSRHNFPKRLHLVVLCITSHSHHSFFS